MKNLNKASFLQKSQESLGEIFDTLKNLPRLSFNDFPAENTALVIVDMNNGFAREGVLMSPRVEALIPEIVRLSKHCDTKQITKLAFGDAHTHASPEFSAYPPHCLVGSFEADIVEEIKAVGGYTLIQKNSTNGFLEDAFAAWLKEREYLRNFVVVGDCTDICVLQFVVTLKTWFNRQNLGVRIIVPEEAVDTFEVGNHNGDLMHAMGLYMMMMNGVEVVAGLDI